MRPFCAWPRWLLDGARAVLVRVPVMRATLTQIDCECFARDVVEWIDAVRAGATNKGVQQW